MLTLSSNNNIRWHCVNLIWWFLRYWWFALCLWFSSCVFQVFLKGCLGVFKMKMSFIIILFLFRNFELIINSNVVKYNCQAQLWWMSTNEISNSPLGFDSKEWFFWLINAGERSFWVDSSFTHCNYIKSFT